MQTQIRVGIAGATGLVGQRLTDLVACHPWFEVGALGASERSRGRTYADAVRWLLPGDPPAAVAGAPVRDCSPESFEGCDVVLSSLGSSVARQVEGDLVDAGFPVVSNSSAYRMDEDVPLVIPEVNPGHLSLIDRQRGESRSGFIVTNPNCSVTGLALALAPLHRAFGIRRVVVATMQALSGAGAEGPRGISALENVLPYIPGEEEKLEQEVAKILDAAVTVSAHCHRVPTLDGHLEAVSVELERVPGSREEAVEVLAGFRGDVADLNLPSAPARPIVVRPEPDRPQPRLDRDTGDGMSVVVGRVRDCPVLTLRLEVLSHNTLRGAAGATLLNAELLVSRGYLGAPGGKP
jgi:aspartate-semialdehyde dehydrogenase